MSLLKDRISRDTEKKIRAEQSVRNMAIRPTVSEQEFADELIQTVSNHFKEEISQKGLTEEIQEKIRSYVRNAILKLEADDYTVKVRIEKIVLSNIIGLGPMDPFLHELSITIRQDGDEIHLDIYNNGEGVPPEDLPFIFDKGFTGNYPNRQKATGMGLYLVRKYAEKLCVKVRLASDIPYESGFGIELVFAL